MAPHTEDKTVELLRLRMDLEALRRSTIRSIDAAMQQVDALLPQVRPINDTTHWSEDIDQW